jgi:hypothetical protein
MDAINNALAAEADGFYLTADLDRTDGGDVHLTDEGNHDSAYRAIQEVFGALPDETAT